MTPKIGDTVRLLSADGPEPLPHLLTVVEVKGRFVRLANQHGKVIQSGAWFDRAGLAPP